MTKSISIPTVNNLSYFYLIFSPGAQTGELLPGDGDLVSPHSGQGGTDHQGGGGGEASAGEKETLVLC